MSQVKSFITKVVVDPDTKDLSIIFPQELLDELDLHENEVLKWEVIDDEKVVITKGRLIG